jgi:hypothetical protein
MLARVSRLWIRAPVSPGAEAETMAGIVPCCSSSSETTSPPTWSFVEEVTTDYDETGFYKI